MDTVFQLPGREAVIAQIKDGHYKLLSAIDAHPLTTILFNTKKAARNWALGRGYVVSELQPVTVPR